MMNYLTYLTKPNLILSIAALFFFLYPLSICLSAESVKTVAITQIVEHPSLDLIRRGIIDELKDQGYHDGKNLRIHYENAQGNIAIAVQIAHKLIGQNPDIIIAIATPSAQTVVKADQSKKIPLVFSAITDPLGAGLVTRLKKPGGYATGIIDLPPIRRQVLLIKQLVPQVKRIGIVYNPGESNTVSQIKAFTEHAQALGIAVVESQAAKTSDVYAATKRLAGNVQAIYIANDNTVVSALEALLKVSCEHRIPVFASDGESVGRGATLALANDQYEVGRETGKRAVKILKGTKPGDLCVLAAKKTKLYINEAAAKAYKLKIPPKLLEQAVRN